MKQEHFMQTLRNELRNLPKHEVDEIVADYREYISDAIAAGRNEEEVISALGDPLKLARELKAQANYRQWENNRTLSNLLRVVVSVAGLGVMNFLLFFPFLFYMLMLSVGYIVSTALVIAGVALVIGAGGNKLFNWPPLPTHYFNDVKSNIVLGSSRHHGHSAQFSLSTDPAPITPPAPPVPPTPPSIGKSAGSDDDSSAGSAHAVQEKSGRFVINLTDGEEANLVLKSGAAVTLESDDGKISIDSDDPRINQVITQESSGAVSVARDQVKVLNIENDEGESFDYVAGKGSDESHWHAHSTEGDVRLDQNPATGSHIAINDGKNSLSIDAGHVQIHDEDGNNISIGGVPGFSLVATLLLLGIGFMCVGVLGLWLCIWISRLTWHGLARYVKYQINVVTGKESLSTTE